MPRSLRLATLLSMLLATPALAQEGSLLDVNEGLIIWTILIFLIVLLVLYKLAFPKILGAVEAREAHIRELLEAAARDRQEAETLLAEQRRETEEVRARVQEMLAEGRGAGEQLRDDILAQARREQEDLLLRTRRDIQGELDRALEQVRDDAVDLAIAAASKLVEKNLDAEDNRRLVREFLRQVELPAGNAPAAGPETMGPTIIARNYAETLLTLARRNGGEATVDEFAAAMDEVAEILRGEPRIQEFLATPRVGADEKKQVLRSAFQGRVPELLLHFLLVVVEKRRQGLLRQIAEEFHALVDEARGRIRAEITLAAPADETLEREIVASLERKLGKTVVPRFQVEPALMGGILVRVGDQILDGTVRRRIRELRRMLASGMRQPAVR